MIDLNTQDGIEASGGTTVVPAAPAQLQDQVRARDWQRIHEFVWRAQQSLTTVAGAYLAVTRIKTDRSEAQLDRLDGGREVNVVAWLLKLLDKVRQEHGEQQVKVRLRMWGTGGMDRLGDARRGLSDTSRTRSSGPACPPRDGTDRRCAHLGRPRRTMDGRSAQSTRPGRQHDLSLRQKRSAHRGLAEGRPLQSGWCRYAGALRIIAADRRRLSATGQPGTIDDPHGLEVGPGT